MVLPFRYCSVVLGLAERTYARVLSGESSDKIFVFDSEPAGIVHRVALFESHSVPPWSRKRGPTP
jgi:hypothetical protein